MQRLAPLVHHIVGHVDEIVDRFDADQLEPVGEPVGGGSNGNALDGAADVPRTQLGSAISTVDDDERVAAEPAELVMEPAVAVRGGEAVDPLGGGGEHDAVAVLAGADGQADGEVGLAGAGRAEEHDVVAGGDEIEGGEVSDDVSLEGALVVEAELVEALAGRKAGGADAELAAVGRPRRDLTFEAGGEELLMGPAVAAGSFGEPFDGGSERRRLQRATQVGDIGGRLRGGGHQRTPTARS